jgi:hypothetical protein
MVNYANGKIYKIEPLIDHDEGDIYIGSTTKNLLCQRMDKHRGAYRQWKNGNRDKVMSFDIFDKYGLENCVITLLETVNANSKDELHTRERYYIQSMKCINKYIPMRTDKEYYEDNKSEISEYQKQHYKDNKDKILEKKKIKFTCDCGAICVVHKKQRHFKTQKHIQYLNNQK